MVDCVTTQRISGIINAANPYQVWLAHITSCAPTAASTAAKLGLSGAWVTILKRADGRFYILAKGKANFILEVALTQADAEEICKVMGWNIE